MVLLLPLMFSCVFVAGAQEEKSELDRMLSGEKYDPNLLIEEADPETSDTFAPDIPAAEGETFSHGRIAMILPSKRPGLAGEASKALLEGFQHAAEIENDLIELAIYATNGSMEDVFLSFDHAVESGVDLVIGPMLKNNVSELLQTRRGVTVTALVTQPVDVFEFDESEFYGISIGYETEAKAIARTVLEAGIVSGAIIVEDASSLGRRVSSSFSREWERLTNTAPRRIPVATQDDLVEMHNVLRAIAKTSVETDSSYWPLVFAAGDRGFVLKVRAHTPGLLALYALSLVNETGTASAADDVTVLGMDNVHIVEMPWILEPDSTLATRYAQNKIRSRTLLEQRFFALGVDIYRLNALRICWKVGCSADGVAGSWRINKGEHNFQRTGILAGFVEGTLRTGDP